MIVKSHHRSGNSFTLALHWGPARKQEGEPCPRAWELLVQQEISLDTGTIRELAGLCRPSSNFSI